MTAAETKPTAKSYSISLCRIKLNLQISTQSLDECLYGKSRYIKMGHFKIGRRSPMPRRAWVKVYNTTPTPIQSKVPQSSRVYITTLLLSTSK